MKPTFLKKGKTAVAWVLSLAMVFATVSFPVSVAKAVDTGSVIPVVKDFSEKQEGAALTGSYELPTGHNFIYIKQANGANVLWTLDDISGYWGWGETIDIGDYDKDSKTFDGPDYEIFKEFFGEFWSELNPNSDLSDPSIDYRHGIGEFVFNEGLPGEYSYEFTEGDGVITFLYDTDKVSHFYSGRYDVEDQDYDISVTKAVTLNGEEDPEGVDGTVYVSLFSDEALTDLLETKSITVTDGVGDTVTFTVDETGTYYVVETDEDGTPIEPGVDMMGHYLVSIDNDQADGVAVTVESSEDVTITNNLVDREPDSVPLNFTKVLEGMELGEGMFDFALYNAEWDDTDDELDMIGLVQRVSNDADGNVVFDDLEFDTEGTFYYIIKELPNEESPIEGVTYDTHVVTLTVVVTFDERTGEYTAVPTFDGLTTFTNTYEEQYGEITVTKDVTVLDEGITVDYTFYTALFNADKERVSEVKALDVVDSESTSVTFTELDLDETYYVYETDAAGNIIETDADGVVATPLLPDWTKISYDNNVVTLDIENRSGEATINNVFDTEDQYLYGSVIVKKTVTLNGEPLKTKRVFYVALFADEALTQLVSDVKALNMNGNATTTVEFLTDKDGKELLAGTVYYVAETDKNGVAISDSKAQLGCEIEIDKPSVEITEDATLVNLVNKFKKEEFPVTGDSSNMNLWLFLAVLGVAGAIAPFALRKREEIND